jgi:transglutaminase-like putative cysteine protease
MAALQRANRTRRPEDSVAFRVAVLISVLVGAAALAAERAIEPTTAVLLFLALPFAYYVSHVRRDKDNWHIKILLTVAALLALVRFLGQLGGVVTLDEVRFPLADLFLWVQVIHGFDLPQRRDLNFSLGSSITLMAVAGSVSQTLVYGIFLAVYLVSAVVALCLSHRSAIEQDTAGRISSEIAQPPSQAIHGSNGIAKTMALTIAGASVAFLLIPQPQAVRTFALPFSLGQGLGVFGGGDIVNPGFGSGDPGQRSGGPSYYGFGDRMDLRVRGDLPDDLVMRVRASASSMWRATVFDTYDGITWTGDQGEPTSLGDSAPYTYPTEFRSLGPREELSQTFYIERELPNVVFAAGQPDLVFFDAGVSIDKLGSLRTAATLTPGSVYSVVSSRGAATAEELRGAGSAPSDALANYLQLPADLPKRVRQLALDVTQGASSDFDRVTAIEDYLAANYRYLIDSPVPEAGRDAVDHFLFDTDVGFCEQFASATAIMLRTLGVPTRVVVGYTPGGRNPFTGYHEVLASDAHSWVEVWFPGFGWYEFDPTFDIPPASPQTADAVPLARVIRLLVSAVGDWAPSGAAGLLRMVLIAALTGTLLAGAWIARRRWRSRRPARVPAAPPLHRHGTLQRAFHSLELVLAARGLPRALSETPREFVQRSARLAAADGSTAAGSVERGFYGGRPLPEDVLMSALSDLEAVRDKLAGASRGAGRPERSIRKGNA